MIKPNSKAGLSLIEVVTAVVLLTMALGLAVTGYMFSLKKTNEGDVQDELDMDLQIALESLKKDLRLSSLDEIFYHPEGPGPYQAISFPVAKDSDGDGLLETGDDGKLIWDETVIYHIRPTTPNQLVKTTFSPRIDLTDAQRQTQIDTVVNTGYGTPAANGENSSSSVLFANLLKWKITPKAGRFDAFAEKEARRQVDLGYCLLDTGSHQFNFKVVGKNSASSGHKIGIDQLYISPSYGAREAETQTVAAQSGATATAEYREGGSWKGNHQLVFPATRSGNNFTLSMENDRWEETNFTSGNYECDDTSIEFNTELSPKDYVVQLKGNDLSWEAALQTGSPLPIDPPTGYMQNWCVRVLLKGSELTDNGNWLAYNGRKCLLTFNAGNNGSLKVSNVFIGEAASSTSATLDFNPSTITAVKFAGGSTDSTNGPSGTSFSSKWVDFEIEKEKNYIVSYSIANNAANCHPSIWTDSRGSAFNTCLVATNGTSTTPADTTWTGRPDTSFLYGIIGLESVTASYPNEGTYTSPIFDTKLDAPKFNNLDWNADIPTGTALVMKIRTGDQPDLSDASDWGVITAHTSSFAINASYKRYVQFQATLTSSSDGLSTPQLKDVTIDWPGEKRMVNIGGLFTMGPEYGTFEVTVDGQPLRSALMVDLEIYKDIFSTKGQMHRISSQLEVNLSPRNTGM